MPRRLIVFLAAVLTLAIAAYSGYLLGRGGFGAWTQYVEIAAGLAVGLIILRNPYIGLGLLFLTIPILDYLPDVPLGTSAYMFMGIATLGSYVLQFRKYPRKPLTLPLFFALVYISWIILSNPAAAFYSSRNWVLTYIQLVIFMFLVRELMTDEKRHKRVLWFYMVGITISGISLVSTAFSLTNLNNQDAVLAGLTDGANNVARYFVIAIPLLNYLYTIYEKNRKIQLLITALIILMCLSTIFTFSRSGFALLGVALLFLIIGRPSPSRKRSLNLRFAILVLLGFVVISQTNLLEVIQTQLLGQIDSAEVDSDIRFDLWSAGIRMWADYPIQGVGLGQFPYNLDTYAEAGTRAAAIEIGPHNIYIAVLAESGMVGLTIFLFLVYFSLRTLWKASHLPDANTSARAWAWLTVLVVILLGGLTKHDQYNKVLWAAFGSSLCFIPYIQIDLVKAKPARFARNFVKESYANRSYPHIRQ